MIISDLSCLEVLSASDDVVGGQTFFSFFQGNASSVSQSISNRGSNDGGFIGNSNSTTQSNTSGPISLTVTEAA